jgi:hypothetical protein
MTRALAVWLLLVAGLAGATAGAAHGLLERSDPRANATVRVPPTQVRLWFAGGIEAAYSRVEVRDEAGRRVDAGDGRVDADDRALLRVSLPALPPGRYTVVWRVLSVDSHVTEGRFTFRLAP